MKRVILGTRKSKLARWQTDHMRSLLQHAWPDHVFDIEVFTTQGDKILDVPLPLIGGKGLFTQELEHALRCGDIDVAVHSLKDLPVECPPGLTIGAVPSRERTADVLVSRTGLALDKLPRGAVIGTSSRRRAAQLLHFRPDLTITDIRGNVDTRIAKAMNPDGPYDGIILAFAGVRRLGQMDVISQILPDEIMLPAPGQGALGVQCRAEDSSTRMLVPIQHRESTAEVTAERAFLAALGGGCATPVAAKAVIANARLRLLGRVTMLDGSQQIDVSLMGSTEDAGSLGTALAREALAQGAQGILEQCARVH